MGDEEPTGINLEIFEKKLRTFPLKAKAMPILQVGAFTGLSGLIAGGVGGILRSSPTPVLFAVASSVQWAALGSAFSATRSTLLHTYFVDSNHDDHLHASGTAGIITGGLVGGVFRGYRNVVPGAIMFGLFGYLGQMGWHKVDSRHSEMVSEEVQRREKGIEKKRLWDRMMDMRWSPFRALSDEEYKDTLHEKLVKVEADLALVDEQIERLMAGRTTAERGQDERRG